MTISSTVRIAGPFIGTGTASAFPFTFKVFNASDLQVVRVDTTTGIETTLGFNTDYAVGLNADQDSNPGGSIVLTSGSLVLAVGFNLIITSDIANLQPTDLTNQGGFYPEVITDALDRATIQIQQMADELTRSIKIPVTDGLNLDMELPSAVDRANSFLSFDASGEPLMVSAGSPGAPTSITRQQFSGTGSQVAFTLASDPGALGNSCEVFIGGIYQQRDTYTISGTTLTFSAAPVAGTDNIEVVNFLTSAIGTTDSSLVTYIPAGAGATQRTVQAKLRDVVNVKDFGAVGNGTTDDTAAIQAAINSGYSLVFPAGTYLCNNLTQSTSFQRFYANGFVNLSKNANGVLLSSTGSYVQFHGIQFLGTGFTGNNVEATGNAFALINCSSFGTPGRAVKCTGNRVSIIGTCGSYTTTDTSGTGYEIEIGVSGTATLYHELRGVYSSTATGGIKLIDTGSQWIVGGQFGKLYIASGTSPAGCNGGIVSACRILGNVTVELSNSVFIGNQFSTQTITFAVGTSLHTLDQSNIATSATIVNNGNSNSILTRGTSTGGTMDLSFGASSWTNTVKLNNVGTWEFSGNLVLPNAKSIQIRDSGGTSINAVVLSSGDDYTFGSNNGVNFTSVSSGTVGVFNTVGGTSITQTTASAFIPVADNSKTCGGASNRWSTVYAVTGTINTSDARSKEQVRVISAAEIAVALQIKGMISAFKFTDAVAAKGNAARIHFGVVAQDVRDAFIAGGLNPDAYGLFCHDSWEGREAVMADDGTIVSPAQEAGDRYGIRYDELLAFIIAGI
jgi:hypothetical protein